MKVGLDMNKDMKTVNTPEAAIFTQNMDMDLDTGASEAWGRVNLNKKLNKCGTLTPSTKDGRKKFPPSNLGFVEMSQCALPRMVGRN